MRRQCSADTHSFSREGGGLADEAWDDPAAVSAVRHLPRVADLTLDLETPVGGVLAAAQEHCVHDWPLRRAEVSFVCTPLAAYDMLDRLDPRGRCVRTCRSSRKPARSSVT